MTSEIYPRGWFKADGPLPDGWYWWRYSTRGGTFTEPVEILGEGYLDFLSKGELCGPIPLPPD